MRRILDASVDLLGGGARVPQQGPSVTIQWGHMFVILIVATFMAAPFVGYLTSLAILTVVGFGAMMLGFGRPGIGVLGVSILCTLDPLVRNFLLTTGGLLRWNTFNYALLIIMAFSVAFIRRLNDPHSRLLKAFTLLLVIDLAISPDVPNGIQHILGLVSTFGLLACLSQQGDDPEAWYVIGLVNGVLGAVGGFAYLMLKASIPYMNTNAWALFPETAVFAVCLGFRAAAKQRNGQLMLGSLAGINAIWAFLSGSRGGILIVAVGLIFILFTIRRTAHRLGFIAVAVAATLMAFTVFGDMETTTMNRITKMLNAEESAASRTSGRSDLALAGLYMAQRQPFGVGTGGFAPTWAKLGFIPGLSSFKRGEEFPAHSAWIKVLAENGWIGLIMMVAWVGSFFFFGVRSRAPGQAALGAMVTAALVSSFLSTEFQGKAVWFLAAGATAQMQPSLVGYALGAQIERAFGRPRRVLAGTASRVMAPVLPATFRSK